MSLFQEEKFTEKGLTPVNPTDMIKNRTINDGSEFAPTNKNHCATMHFQYWESSIGTHRFRLMFYVDKKYLSQVGKHCLLLK